MRTAVTKVHPLRDGVIDYVMWSRNAPQDGEDADGGDDGAPPGAAASTAAAPTAAPAADAATGTEAGAADAPAGGDGDEAAPMED